MKTRIQCGSLMLAVLLVAFSSTLTFAQKKTKEDKALEKEWKKKMSDLDPLEYKRLVEENAAAKAEASEMNSKISTFQNEMTAKTTEVDQLKAQVEDLKKKAAEEVASNVTSTNVGVKKATATANGVVFKVQIGSFRNKDLSKYFENNPNFSGDVDADGSKKYTLGYFSDYWEADTFKKYLREMGVKDAWTVAYKNGQRVNIKDVLEGAI
ncbi:MAG: Ezrin/radixin/moesin family protein [Bacteroidota bacterium]